MEPRPTPTKPTFRVVAGEKSARRDNVDVLQTLYQQYGGSVYGRCAYLLKDRNKAEDAMQDVFAKAIEHHATFRSEASPLTWLIKIATNHCLNLMRSERAGWHDRFRREELARAPGRGGPQVFEMRDLVRKLLARFDEETQAAAVHYHVDEMTLEEVAALLGRSVPTIRKRLEEFSAACEKERWHDDGGDHGIS